MPRVEEWTPMLDQRDHELFTHAYVDPPTVVLPRVHPSAARRAPFVGGARRRRALRAFGITVAVGFLALVVIGVAAPGGGTGTGSTPARGSTTTSAAGDCSRAVLAAFEDGITDGDIGTAAMRIIDAYGTTSVEHDAWQAALASGAQSDAFRRGAAAGVATATPAVQQACRNGYGNAPAASASSASSLPSDACSVAVLDALAIDRQVATLRNAPGGQQLVTTYGVQSTQYQTYSAVMVRYMTTSVEYGTERAAAEVAPAVEARCTR